MSSKSLKGTGNLALQKWKIDFPDNSSRKNVTHSPAQLPPGYVDNISHYDETAESSDSTIVTKQGWGIALGPWKQLPMNLFLMFMAGNSISLFPIMMVGMMAYRPVQALISYREVFSKLSGDQAALQQFSYILANLLGLAMAMYKCHTMGLLPTSQSDWVEFMDQQQIIEFSSGGIALS